MRLSDFDFALPVELIAQNPVEPRDNARLFVYDRLSNQIEFARVKDIGKYLPVESIIIANNSKVRKARIYAMAQKPHSRGEPKCVEILVLEVLPNSLCKCMVSGHRNSVGAILTVDPNLPVFGTIVEVVPHEQMQTFIVKFNLDSLKIESYLEANGIMPLPPYIQDCQAESGRYQTVYAKHSGSSAAPTAGLHFTPRLIKELKQRGFIWQEVTLHVGLGTFLPLRNEVIESNQLHAESLFIDANVANVINQAKASGRSVLSVGTTSTRVLESRTVERRVLAGNANTDIFIYPGYSFQTVNLLLTNFHLPKTSLLMLVSAFLGNNQMGHVTKTPSVMLETLQRLYAIAIENKFQFYSYGDAMLVL